MRHSPKDGYRYSVSNVLNTLLRPRSAGNILLLAPLLAAHQLISVTSLAEIASAFLVLSLCDSSAYLLNDVLDRYLPPIRGLLVSLSLLGIAASTSLWLPTSLHLAAGMYYFLTFQYIRHLKHMALVDAFALTGLHVIRIVAGAAAIGAPLSFWLLLFAIFFFLSLAFLKQYAGLDSKRRQQEAGGGGGYDVEDLPVLRSLGTGAGYASVLILGLYINSPEIEVMYSRPKWIWMLCMLVLYWISRMWMITERGQMTDGPTAFVRADRQTLAVGVLAVAVLVLAT